MLNGSGQGSAPLLQAKYTICTIGLVEVNYLTVTRECLSNLSDMGINK